MSDSSGRIPKGAMVRPAPDWFSDNLAYGGAVYQTDPPVGNTYASISLFNDAQTGVVLKVYALTVGNDDTGTAFAYTRQGPPLGVLQGQCRFLRADRGVSFGQIWMRTDTVGSVTALYPLALPQAPATIGAPDAGSATILSAFPLFIIPTGYSLVIANADSGSRAWASFWFHQSAT